MGTSLSGLTPATTFDGLLKVGDNDPLTATLKPISTGDGTDTILQLSNSALSIGGDTSVSGGVNTSASNALTIQNSDGTQLFAVRNDGRLLLGTSSNLMYLDGALLQTWQINNSYFSGQRVGVGVNASGSYRLHIKGSGATSATTSLLVQNSAGSELFKVIDDGKIYFGQYNYTTGNYWYGNYTFISNIISRGSIINDIGSVKVNDDLNVGGNADNDTGVRLQVKGSGNDATTTALLVQNSDGTELMALQDDGATRINLNNTLKLVNNLGSTRVTFDGDGNLGIREGSPQARLHIKGAGATSATTALLVKNSAGTALLKVEDGGKVVAGTGATTNANGTFNVLHKITDSATRVFTASRDSVLRGLDINSGGSTKISDYSGDQSFSHTATAVLEVSSTTQGFLPPRMTTTQRDAITTPAAGLMIYNTDTNTAECWNGTAWMPMF